MRRIVEGLPDYFTPNVPQEVARDMAAHQSWVTIAEDRVIASAVMSTRFPRSAEVLWAGRRAVAWMGRGAQR